VTGNIPEPTASNPDVTDAVYEEMVPEPAGVLTVRYVNGAGLETFSLRTSLHFAETISMVVAIADRLKGAT